MPRVGAAGFFAGARCVLAPAVVRPVWASGRRVASRAVVGVDGRSAVVPTACGALYFPQATSTTPPARHARPAQKRVMGWRIGRLYPVHTHPTPAGGRGQRTGPGAQG